MSNFWRREKLGNICQKITDGTHKTPIYQDTGVVFLSARNIKNGTLSFANHKFISKDEHLELTKRCRPETGDVMLSKSGSLGDAIMIPELPFSFSIFESLALIKPKKNVLSPEYLQHYLNSPLSKRYFWSITSGIAVKHLHLVDLRKMPICIPSLNTQTDITDTLNHWDSAIEKTEALIAAKEKQFEWLKTQLIANPSKNHGWKCKKLNDLVEIKKGEQLNRIHLTKTGRYPAWNGGISPSGYTDNFNTIENTVTISEGGNSCGFVNYCKERFWCGGHCYSLLDVSDQIIPSFLFYFLKSHEKKIMQLRVGSGLPNIQKKDIAKFSIIYPSRSIQVEISATLTTTQKEIKLLKKTLAKYRLQKRGLMQKLLTGEWPVSVPTETTDKTPKELSA
tara:strand:+ start:15804 stop:16982 length:1179 start_codon:yes stop_codon:yes gene_type:complete